MTTAELIERLERAEAPSRELDAEIAALVHVDADGLDFEAFPEPSGKVTIYFPSKVKQAYAAHRYTASIDAALTLVPEGWRIAGFAEYGHGMKWKGRIYCALVPSDLSHLPRTYAAHSAAAVRFDHPATPAIALCIAALKAKEADNG